MHLFADMRGYEKRWKYFFKEAGFLDTDIGLSRERFIIIQFSRGSRETETNQIFHLLILTFINFFFHQKHIKKSKADMPFQRLLK